MVRKARAGRNGRMAVTGVMAVIFVMAVTRGMAAMAVKAAVTAITAMAAKAAITAITGAKGPLPTAGTMTGPQAGGSLTVRPVRRTASARSAMTAMVRAGGLRVRRAMTGPAATTDRASQTARIVKTVKTGQTVLVARTGRTETTVAARGATLVAGVMAVRAVIPGAVQAATETAGVTTARTGVPARAAASPNRGCLAAHVSIVRLL